MNNLESLKNNFNKLVANNNIEYPSENKAIIALALYSKIIENTKGFILLLEQGNLRGPLCPIVRNSLEALIDLENLLNKDGYEFYLTYLDLKEIIRGLNKNCFKERLGDDYDSILTKKKADFKYYENLIFKNYTEFTQTTKQKNKKEKISIKTGIDKKFKFSSNSIVYDTVYYYLCTYTHNSINSLETDYISNLLVSAFVPLNEADLIMFSQTMEYILIDSVHITEKNTKK